MFLAWILSAACVSGALSFTYKSVNEHLANQRRTVDLLDKIANGPRDH